MKRTEFNIQKMDCPSEENLIRLKLKKFNKIKQFNFDLDKRTLSLIHNENTEQIKKVLDELKLDTKLIGEREIAQTDFGDNRELNKKLLLYVLIINAGFFLIEGLGGIIYNSMGLSADALDMLADAVVYGLSLLAVYKSTDAQQNIAKISGYFQITLAVIGIIETTRRFLGFEGVPNYYTMIFVSLFALMGNWASLIILNRTKSKEAHIKASKIFTSNDIIINLGVIIAGIMVLVTDSKYPDLIAGMIIFLIVFNGSRKILALSRN